MMKYAAIGLLISASMAQAQNAPPPPVPAKEISAIQAEVNRRASAARAAAPNAQTNLPMTGSGKLNNGTPTPPNGN